MLHSTGLISVGRGERSLVGVAGNLLASLHTSEWVMTDEMTEGARPLFAASRPKKQQTKRGCSAGIQVSHLDGQRVQVLMQVLGSRVLVSWRNPGVRSNGGCSYSYSLATQRNTPPPDSELAGIYAWEARPSLFRAQIRNRPRARQP